jgi:hypothetical protein
LYAIEAEIRGSPPDQRKAIRQARSKLLLDEFHRWMIQVRDTLSHKSETTAAIQYALNRWDALVRYVDDGRIEVDNNAAERSLRGIAVGRRNYMFMGSDEGGHRAAAIYSLIGTAKLNDRKRSIKDSLFRESIRWLNLGYANSTATALRYPQRSSLQARPA